MSSIDHLLPPSLLLSPHLSAARYFLVCTLTIAAWDSLVLTVRIWRMIRTPEWSLLKTIIVLLRYLMPIEFVAVAVAYFDPNFSSRACHKFYLFEPITTAVLMTLASTALVIRVSAIHEKTVSVKLPLFGLLFIQVALHFACCFFYRVVPLPAEQGCVSGPKHKWVGIYWVGPTALYAATLVLAITRSAVSLSAKKISWWKLIIRDGLNLYATIFAINFINVLFWFIARPTDDADPIRTIVTSMAAVLTTTMTMRIILIVRGPLAQGGTFDGTFSSRGTAINSSSGATRRLSRNVNTNGIMIDVNRPSAPTYSIGGVTVEEHRHVVEDSKPVTKAFDESSEKGEEKDHGRPFEDLAYGYDSYVYSPPARPKVAAKSPHGIPQVMPPQVRHNGAEMVRREVWELQVPDGDSAERL